MSTKTIYKRIALVAVATLGAGLLSVAPANAALATTAAVVTNTSGTVYGSVGTAATASIRLATTTDETNAGAIVITPTIASQPVGGGLTVGAPASGTVGLTAPVVTGTSLAATATANKFTNTVSAGVQSLTYASGTIVAFAATDISTLSLTATVAGTYTVTLTPAGAATTNTPVTVTFNIAGLAYSLGDGAAVTPATSGNGIAGPANTVTVNATTNASNTRALVTVSGAGATIASNAGNAVAAGVTSTLVAAGTNAAIIINTPQVGTVTVSQYYESGNGTGIYAATASKTATITVGAAAVNGTLSVANSTSIIDGTIGADDEAWSTITADETVVVTSAASATLERAVIKVVLKDTLTNFMPNATAISAVITGPGLLAIGTTQPTTALGRAVSSATLASGAGAVFISVYSDGTAGVGTITISVGTTTVATETVKFYGSVASIVATSKISSIDADGGLEAGVFEVLASDAAGVPVPGLSIVFGAAADATLVTTAAGAANTDAAGKSLVGVTPVAGKYGTTTVTVKVGTVFSNAITVVFADDVIATATLAFDKTTYLPGEKAKLTMAAKDKNGLIVPDALTAATTLAFSSNLSTTSTFGTQPAFVAGAYAQDVFAPANTSISTWTISVKIKADAIFATTLVPAAGATLTATANVGIPPVVVPVVVPPVVYDNPTLSFVKDGGRVILSGTAVDGEGDIIIYTKKVGTTAWKERAKTLEVAAPGDFNGSIKAPKSNVLIRVKQEGTGQFSNQIIVLK